VKSASVHDIQKDIAGKVCLLKKGNDKSMMGNQYFPTCTVANKLSTLFPRDTTLKRTLDGTPGHAWYFLVNFGE
jgi:hypothetical protein